MAFPLTGSDGVRTGGRSFVLLWLMVFSLNMSAAVKYDWVIRNGWVFIGDGSSAQIRDIGLKDGVIYTLGNSERVDSDHTIDAKGLVVTPGFIDIHTHADEQIVNIPSADNYLLQGVTTLIGGNCGGHQFPLSKTFTTLKKIGIAVNFGSFAGHNTIRQEVMGLRSVEPSDMEMEEMKGILDREMQDGAMGLSTGLEYAPGVYSKTSEIMKLAALVGSYGGVYATHLRNEDLAIKEAILEAIAVGEAHHLTVQISHLKLCRDEVWGRLDLITEPIAAARGRGLKVFTDQYPYAASVTVSNLFFPDWALKGGQEQFVEQIKNPETHRRIREEIIRKKLSSKEGVKRLQRFIVSSYYDPQFIGKNLEELLRLRSQACTLENAADLIVEMQMKGGAGFTAFQMSEEDVESLMKLDYNMIASDGVIAKAGTTGVHCRSYGTFPRVIRKYVLEKKNLSLATAFYKMTSMPAASLGLKNRGMIKQGYAADIVIMDMDKITDMATYQNPFLFPKGILYVWVNGVLSVRDGVLTGERAGQILYGPGKKTK